jgi:hypothetical protein
MRRIRRTPSASCAIELGFCFPSTTFTDVSHQFFGLGIEKGPIEVLFNERVNSIVRVTEILDGSSTNEASKVIAIKL